MLNLFKKNKEKIVYAPLSGEVVPLEKVSDEVFSTGAMGKGIAIIPNDGKIYAPCDGEITTFFPTGHAIGITADNGLEILIHCGLDTVKLEGEGFEKKAKQDDKITKGQLLLEVDTEKIKSKGYDTVTPVIITNTADYSSVVSNAHGIVNAGEELIVVK